LAVLAFVFLLALSFQTSRAEAQSHSQAEAAIAQAYGAILGAQQSGGDVTSLVAQLNSAISLVQRADVANTTDPSQAQSLYAQASSLAAQVVQSAPGVAAAGRASVMTAQIDLAIETVFLGVLAVAAYLSLPRIFWSLWLSAHRDWRVSKR